MFRTPYSIENEFAWWSGRLAFMGEELIKVARFFGGDEAVKVVETLQRLKEATDDTIAAETGIRLNTVRKILYKLYDHALVSSTRVRNETTGWYTFFWRLQPDQVDAFIRARKRRTLEKLKSRLEHERSHSFFICEKCSDVRMTFEEAMETAFRCPKCGGHLTGADNSRIIEKLSDLIKKLEDELRE
jgi:transcription initiation factor TFIIE subunit alpha